MTFVFRTPNADSLALQTLAYRAMGHEGQQEDAPLAEIPAFLLKPSFAALVQDRASELITLDSDNDADALERRRAIFEELYQAATREVSDGN